MSCPAAPPSLADRLALILDGLCRVLAVRGSRERAAAPLMLLLWTRLRRTVQRFADLASRHRAGTLRPVRPYSPAPGRKPPPPGPLLPRRFGWLVARVPEAAVYGEYLRQVLADPEMAPLLEAAPQAARLLRPLCRMLAVPSPPALLRKRRVAPPQIQSPAPEPAPDPTPSDQNSSAPTAARRPARARRVRRSGFLPGYVLPRRPPIPV